LAGAVAEYLAHLGVRHQIIGDQLAAYVAGYLARLGLGLCCLLVMHQAALLSNRIPHTLSTILNPRDASGRLSRLMAASSIGICGTSPHPSLHHLHMQRRSR